jgi:hypothetical protein
MNEASDSGWFNNFVSHTTYDLMATSCLLYSDLSTWNLRDMSFDPLVNPGYYYAYNGNDEMIFNPCRQINFQADYEYNPDPNINWYRNIEEIIDEVEFGTFGVYRDGESGRYFPLNKFAQWEPEVYDAMYLQDEEGEVISY